ncbi:MAG: hypothetical protein HC875_21210 [Anaerolineales bacterium]|nr:hypothetical protein [Anaerolineales bacterium]
MAQEPQDPVIVTGVVIDNGVTRTITLTLILSPVQVIEVGGAYTATLGTGSSFELQRSVTYGEALLGVGPLILVFLVVTGGILEGIFNNDRNG